MKFIVKASDSGSIITPTSDEIRGNMVVEKIVSALGTITAFRELPTNDRKAIAHLFVGGTFLATQNIISLGEEEDHVYFILHGVVRATLYTLSGKEISYQDVGPGNTFGELAAIDNQPRSTHVRALKDTEVLVLSGTGFREILSTYPQIALSVLEKMGNIVRFLCDRVYEYGAFDTSRRVRAELVRLAEQVHSGDFRTIDLQDMPTHQELASKLATEKSTITKELEELESKGVITHRDNHLTILKLDELRSSVWS